MEEALALAAEVDTDVIIRKSIVLLNDFNHIQCLLFACLRDKNDPFNIALVAEELGDENTKLILLDIAVRRNLMTRILSATEDPDNISPKIAFSLLSELLQGDFSDVSGRHDYHPNFSGLSGEEFKEKALEAAQKVQRILQLDIFQQEFCRAFSDFFSHDRAIAA